MTTFSMDLRDRVVAACDEGVLSRDEIAEAFSVSTSWIRRLLQRRRELGSYAPLATRRGRKPKFDESAGRQLGDLVSRRPDATLAELLESSGVSCSTVTVHNTLKRLGFVRKKRASGRRSRIVRTWRGRGGPGGGRPGT